MYFLKTGVSKWSNRPSSEISGFFENEMAFFLYSWPFSLCHKVIFLSYVLQKIMESLNLSYETIEKQWLKNYQCKSLRSQNMDDLSI